MGADPSQVPIQPKIRDGERAAAQGFCGWAQQLGLRSAKPIDYEVPGDARTLQDLWSRTLLRHCRHCGEVHRFSFRAAYVAGILAIRGMQSPG
jgi:hypothetical protein